MKWPMVRRVWTALGMISLSVSLACAHENMSMDSLAPQGIGGEGPFSSLNVDLGSHLTIPQLGGIGANVFGNDIWGWTDPLDGREYAIYGRSNGTSFVDITDPYHAIYLGDLPTRTGNNIWRGVKVYQNHAFVVADNNGPHGMQVFDLTRLRSVTTPVTFTEDGVATTFREAHNIAINEQSGFAYLTGTEQASGGLVFYDIRNPTSPVRVGQFGSDGYTHDVQVINYDGPDTAHVGREIAFAANEDTLTIVDVTNKTSPTQLGRRGYAQSGYTHQGWLTEDRHYFVVDDEFDETNGAPFTRTHVFDVSDLDNPVYVGYQNGTQSTIDHNLFIKGDLVFEANYTSGLRILKLQNPGTASLPEVGYFDTYPNSNSKSYNGAWGNYPFFDSGSVIVNDMQNGLFVLRPDFINSDLNGDSSINCADIDLLVAEVLAGGNNPAYDLNGDGVVNLADRDTWLQDAGEDVVQGIYGFRPGDINLDGFVDGSDFNAWNTNKFTANASWCGGDVNSDGVVDGSDMNIWNANKFTSSFPAPRVGTQVVPEPAGMLLLVALGAVSLIARRR